MLKVLESAPRTTLSGSELAFDGSLACLGYALYTLRDRFKHLPHGLIGDNYPDSGGLREVLVVYIIHCMRYEIDLNVCRTD